MQNRGKGDATLLGGKGDATLLGGKGDATLLCKMEASPLLPQHPG